MNDVPSKGSIQHHSGIGMQAREYVPVPDNQTRVHDDLQLSPSLEAIKEVYLEAYKYGMSTAFITGRNEGSRDHTESNLKAVGLGEKCAQDGQGSIIRSKDTPCYVALHLRDLKSVLPHNCIIFQSAARLETFTTAQSVHIRPASLL